jgi:hypothetical protein
MPTPPAPLKKIDLTESVAGEEDPGASIDLVANVPEHTSVKPIGPQAPASGMDDAAQDESKAMPAPKPGGKA